MYPLLEAFRRDVSKQYDDLRFAAVDFKCDWPAMIEMAGMRTWSHNLHGCPVCLVRKRGLASVAGFTAKTSPFELYTDEMCRDTLEQNFKDSGMFC